MLRLFWWSGGCFLVGVGLGGLGGSCGGEMERVLGQPLLCHVGVFSFTVVRVYVFTLIGGSNRATSSSCHKFLDLY